MSAGPQVESKAQKISLPSRVLSTPHPGTLERTDPFESLETPSKQVSFLHVDDNAINLRMISVFMTKLGHIFDTAANGLEAVDMFRGRAGQIRCIFMDISMPVMDGFRQPVRRHGTHQACDGGLSTRSTRRRNRLIFNQTRQARRNSSDPRRKGAHVKPQSLLRKHETIQGPAHCLCSLLNETVACN